MKDAWRNLALPCSIVVASVIISIGMIGAAKIIRDSIKIRDNDSMAKIAYELAKALNGKDTGRFTGDPINQKMPEAIGDKKVGDVTVGTNPLKGMASAPVLIVEFSDFQCPFTKRFYQQTFPQIEKEYISTGKVKFAYRDFTLDFHQLAKPAAILARCAGKQGKYWEMFNKLLMGDSLDNEIFKKYTQELNLNLSLCEKCQGTAEIKEAVDRDIKDADMLGVEGTPSFFINGRFVNGAQPYEVFKKIIDEEFEKSVNNN
jgi:protein-disulfide isomerase